MSTDRGPAAGRPSLVRESHSSPALDRPDVLAVDASGMLGHAAELGVELLRSWDSTPQLAGLLPADPIDSLVVAAVGGSASGGDYLAALAHNESLIPVYVIRAPTLPAHIREKSLVVACSYSGNTREVLRLYDQARCRGTALVSICAGGELLRRSTEHRTPTRLIDYDAPPRAALPHVFGPLLRLASQLGALGVSDDDVRIASRTHDMLARCLGPGNPFATNRAKQLGAALVRKFTLVLAAEHLEPAATRFRNQLAENGKAFAASAAVPDAGHNLVVALDGAPRFVPPRGAVVTIESPGYRPETKRAFDETVALFEGAQIPVHRLRLTGASPLADLLEATAWGDFASCYLALAQGVDPSPVAAIERLKEAMGRRHGTDERVHVPRAAGAADLGAGAP